MAMKLVDAEQLEADLTSVADKIRAKTGGEEKLAFPSGFESELDTIESADSALAEVEYMMSAGYTDYSGLFCFLDQMTEVPERLIRHRNQGKGFGSMFQGCISITSVPAFLPTSEKINANYMFSGCSQLVTVEGIDLTNNDSNYVGVFGSCYELQNITFYGYIKPSGLDLSPCTKLTHNSLMSAINALYDWASEGSTSPYTLTLGSTNLAKLTDAEKAIATQKGWTLA